MSYNIHSLAKMAGVSVRTLHYYDEKGLLPPSYIERNGYRRYEEKELLRLQQILFFRELDFPLEDIRKILDAPHFDLMQALNDHRRLLEAKKKRLAGLLQTITRTMSKLQKKHAMNDEELYDFFDDPEQKKLQEEARERWGNTKAWRQSQERTKHWRKEDYTRLKKDADVFMRKFASIMHQGIKSKEIQEMIAAHHTGIERFYDCSIEMYKNLGDMYIQDSRFTAYYEKYAKGLAQFMRDAMHYYADTKIGRKA